LAPVDFLALDSLPEISTAMDVRIMPLESNTGFEITIENIRDQPDLLKNISEGAWVVHNAGQVPFFEVGEFGDLLLKKQAEDNSNAEYREYLEDNSGWFSSLSPGAYTMNDSLFYIGSLATNAMESLAEDGDPSGFTDTFDTPVGASGPDVLAPGQSYTFQISATSGDYFSMASKLMETNDWYVGTQIIPLFQNNKPLTGIITNNFKVYDAGTEIDEYPQLGPNQAPRQPGNNEGPSEDAMLDKEVDESFKIPEISDMIKVTLEAN